MRERQRRANDSNKAFDYPFREDGIHVFMRLVLIDIADVNAIQEILQEHPHRVKLAKVLRVLGVGDHDVPLHRHSDGDASHASGGHKGTSKKHRKRQKKQKKKLGRTGIFDADHRSTQSFKEMLDALQMNANMHSRSRRGDESQLLEFDFVCNLVMKEWFAWQAKLELEAEKLEALRKQHHAERKQKRKKAAAKRRQKRRRRRTRRAMRAAMVLGVPFDENRFNEEQDQLEAERGGDESSGIEDSAAEEDSNTDSDDDTRGDRFRAVAFLAMDAHAKAKAEAAAKKAAGEASSSSSSSSDSDDSTSSDDGNDADVPGTFGMFIAKNQPKVSHEEMGSDRKSTAQSISMPVNTGNYAFAEPRVGPLLLVGARPRRPPEEPAAPFQNSAKDTGGATTWRLSRSVFAQRQRTADGRAFLDGPGKFKTNA